MCLKKKTIRDIPVDGKTILVRVDYNVPQNAEGGIDDDFRIRQSIPTINYLVDRGCKVILIAHLGRPKDPEPRFSLKPIAVHLSSLLAKPVTFVDDCIGDKVSVVSKKMQPGQIVILENLRFHPEEEANSMEFARKLATSSGAQYFVQDGFGVVHRAHASTDAICHVLPSVAGLLLEKEFNAITQAIESPKHPVVAIFGGAKVSDKITALEKFVQIADHIVIGGAMANTFLKYRGFEVGESKIEPGEEETIASVYAKARDKVGEDKVDEFIILPVDAAITDDINSHMQRKIMAINNIKPNQTIMDIGPQTAEKIIEYVRKAGTVIWSGTLGFTEELMFAYGSAKLASALMRQHDRTFSVIGGGDTADFVLHWDSESHGANFGLVSTGGSAALELMAGQKMPGVESLLPK